MSIYAQLSPIHESVVQAKADQRAKADQLYSERLHRALSALGVDPGYIAVGVYTDHTTNTTLQLTGSPEAGVPAFSERTTALGTRLSFTFVVQAVLPPHVIEDCEAHGVKPPAFFTNVALSVMEGIEDADRVTHQLTLFKAFQMVIDERDQWLVNWAERDSAPAPEAEIQTMLRLFARALKPHLDALEG